MTVVTSKRRSERRNEIIKISARAWRLIRDYYFCHDRRQLSGSAVEHDVELFHDLSDMIDIDGSEIYISDFIYIYIQHHSDTSKTMFWVERVRVHRKY